MRQAPRNVKKLACMTLCSPVMEFACEVWDPYLVKHQTRLKNVQRHTVRFIVGRRGVESVELVVDRRKAARNSLLMKIIGDDRYCSLVDCFDSLSKGSHLHYTKSAASNSNLCALSTNKIFYFNSFYQELPMTYVEEFFIVYT